MDEHDGNDTTWRPVKEAGEAGGTAEDPRRPPVSDDADLKVMPARANLDTARRERRQCRQCVSA
jgi:hypothetical protein